MTGTQTAPRFANVTPPAEGSRIELAGEGDLARRMGNVKPLRTSEFAGALIENLAG